MTIALRTRDEMTPTEQLIAAEERTSELFAGNGGQHLSTGHIGATASTSVYDRGNREIGGNRSSIGPGHGHRLGATPGHGVAVINR